jgi:hypothetical protein
MALVELWWFVPHELISVVIRGRTQDVQTSLVINLVCAIA